MRTKTKAIIAAVVSGFVIAFGIVANLTVANAGPAEPFRQPTPGPARPHAAGPVSDTWSWPVPHGIGWPSTNGLGGTHLG